jgi:hypothetical protein
MNKNRKYIATCLLMLSCPIALNTSDLSSRAAVFSAPSISKSVKPYTLTKDVNRSSESTPEEPKLAGSDTPSKWVYSKNRSIACRIKQWRQGEYESYVDIEFLNVNSKKPVNMVYGLIATDKEGLVNRGLFNAYKDEQYNLTEFKPPLKKGQTKVSQIHKKYLKTWSKLDLTECRVSKSNESFLTLNPEMRNYVGD